MLAVLSVAMPVFLLILIGGFAGRYGFLGRDATGALNMFVVYLSLPAVLFQAMAHINPADLLDPGLLAAFGAGIAASFVPALAIALSCRTKLGNAAMQALAASHCNTGYMGIPLCRMAFGDDSLVPGVITMVITACPQFALAITLVEMDRPGASALVIARRVGRALVTNPLLIAPVAGLAVSVAGLPIPLIGERFLTILGAAATPCALVATGMMVAESQEKFRPLLVGRLVFLKLFVQPAAAWVVAYRLMEMPPAWAGTAVLMSALPTSASAFILAKLYGREAATTSGAVLVSTVVSFFTLSILLAWLT
ncbi:MAG: AEC family transporter [Acetobacteraceae bacterium]